MRLLPSPSDADGNILAAGPSFMVDVGESSDQLWPMELNGFGCSGLYR
jgi:hypothetical protein